jgi:hypothetical protein
MLIYNHFFTIGFGAKNSIARVYRKLYPRILEMYPYLKFNLYFKVKPRSIAYLKLKVV